MGYGFFDAVADAATGGVYSATKATVKVTEAAAHAIGTAAGAIAGENAGSASGISGGQGSQSIPGTTTCAINTCFPFTIEGDYLLNSETGQVWLINAEKKVLLPIKYSANKLESGALAVQLEKYKDYLLAHKDFEVADMSHAARKEFSHRFDTFIKVIDEDIDSYSKVAAGR